MSAKPCGEAHNPITGAMEPAYDCSRCGERKVGFQMTSARYECRDCSNRRRIGDSSAKRTMARHLSKQKVVGGSWRGGK